VNFCFAGADGAPLLITTDSAVWAAARADASRPRGRASSPGKYHGRIAAANILGERREADYTAVPRVVFTYPQAAAVGAADGPVTSTISLSAVPKTATYLRAWDEHPGFLTLVSDGEVLTGAYGVGPEAGEWMQQATVAIRARVPLTVLNDTIQPFPTFSEAFHFALAELTSRVPTEAR
jgi:pyruvate/2-oxoglutarate dehydrogenase complex dihydrolipoamide dehydrogenase (E3) component